MGGVVFGLGFEEINMVWHHPIQKLPKGMNLVNALKGLLRFGVGEPKLILRAKPGMKVKSQGARGVSVFTDDPIHKRTGLWLHALVGL